MSNLKRKIADLEVLKNPVEPMQIIIRFLEPGNLGGQLQQLILLDGPVWERSASETEIEFENRVLLEARCKTPKSNNLILMSQS